MKNRTQVNQRAQGGRRGFLKTTAHLCGALAVLGVSTEVRGGATPEPEDASMKAFNDLFKEAVDTGDIKAAINKYGKAARLTGEGAKELERITKEELLAVKKVRDKFLNGRKFSGLDATRDVNKHQVNMGFC